MAKAPSAWLTEKYTAPSGKIYQRYVLDEKGNKIPRDPNMTPEQIAAIKTQKVEKVKKAEIDEKKKDQKIRNKLNRAYRKSHAKRLVPIDITAQMRVVFEKAKKGEGNVRCVEFEERNSTYRIVLADNDKDWLLVHAQIKKNMDYEHKWFFFNPFNEASQSFDHLAHIESKVGDKGLQWPEKSTAALPEPEVKKAKRTRAAKA